MRKNDRRLFMKKILSVVLCLALVLSLGISSFAIKTVPVTKIAPALSTVTLNVGTNYNSKITYTPANTTQKIVKYSTSNKNVATVDSKGVVKAVSAGSAVITITSASKSSVKAKFTVKVSKKSAPKNQVTLTWTLVGNKQETDTALVMKKVEQYLKDKLNVKINLQVYGWNDPYNQKVNTMLASGEPFDVCFTANWAANYYMNAASGYFTELNSYLKKYPAIGQIVGKDFLNASQVDGKSYAVPTNKEKVHNWGYLVMQKYVDKYKINLKSIKKMEDLEPWFAKIKANEPGITPLLITGMDSPFKFIDWDNFSDDDVPGALYPDNRNSKVVNQFTAPESIAMYKTLRSYYEKGWIAKDAATMENTSEQMKTGKYFAVESSLKPGKDAEMSASTGVDWVQVDLTKPVMLMIGNETDGLCRAFKEYSDILVTIPMSENSSASSFNVGCAATVMFYEVMRQRLTLN
jgi:tRNA(Leu) C34 or U34 (ribose-2'-O)-methylase TrmL